jgi:tRNA (Thr-GGU) A37 N-methylase
MDAGEIAVPYIDTENGTPVVDIKPYHPSEDRIREAQVPAWCDHWPKWYEDSGSFDWEAEFNY